MNSANFFCFSFTLYIERMFRYKATIKRWNRKWARSAQQSLVYIYLLYFDVKFLFLNFWSVLQPFLNVLFLAFWRLHKNLQSHISTLYFLQVCCYYTKQNIDFSGVSIISNAESRYLLGAPLNLRINASSLKASYLYREWPTRDTLKSNWINSYFCKG